MKSKADQEKVLPLNILPVPTDVVTCKHKRESEEKTVSCGDKHAVISGDDPASIMSRRLFYVGVTQHSDNVQDDSRGHQRPVRQPQTNLCNVQQKGRNYQAEDEPQMRIRPQEQKSSDERRYDEQKTCVPFCVIVYDLRQINGRIHQIHPQ